MAKAKETEQKLIKSRKRVRDHGEVFTPDWLVRDMCDLVAAQCADVGARFLEPACGDGNFLVEILRRKLDAARALVGSRESNLFRREAFRALTSLYGVDILVDNVKNCRANLYTLWESKLGSKLKKAHRHWEECQQSAWFILEKNIVHGDTLHPEGTVDLPPIVFIEWTLSEGCADSRGRRPDELASGQVFALADLLPSNQELFAFTSTVRTRPIRRLHFWQLGLGQRAVPPLSKRDFALLMEASQINQLSLPLSL